MTSVAARAPVVSCDRLSKTYGTGSAATLALRGLSLEIAAGELTMLVGPSGCGKSTLLSIIAGLLEPDSGACTVLGRRVSDGDERDRAAFRRGSVGFMFQAFNLLPGLAADENVAIPLLLSGVPRADALARARRVLADVGLSERTATRPRQLSGGQQQRVALARALVHAPTLLICDEPTSSLDHATGEDVMRQLRSIADEPTRATIVVTHDARILEFADRIVSMEDGRVIGDERPGATGASA